MKTKKDLENYIVNLQKQIVDLKGIIIALETPKQYFDKLLKVL